MEQPDIQSLSLEDEEEMLFSKEAVTTKGLNYSLCLVGRVLVDVNKPLKRTKKIRKEGRDAKIISFKYDSLGLFCYFCGFIGHTDEFCCKLFKLDKDDGERAWGPKIPADPRSSAMAGRSQYLREGGQ
ncbi:hypothetical protein GmHk_12G034502 [Glycine max]|nr:hypothetical protein GmHk_12G034502 [Glycine max]